MLNFLKRECPPLAHKLNYLLNMQAVKSGENGLYVVVKFSNRVLFKQQYVCEQNFTAFPIKQMSTKFESQPRRYVRFLGKNTASFNKIEKRMSKPQFLRKPKMG